MRCAPPWSQVKLRVTHGDLPEIGDELRFRSGRRYQVIAIRGRGLVCLVIPMGDTQPIEGQVLHWQWAPRNRKVKR